MNKEIVNTNKAPQPAGPYSQAVKANGFLFLAGQVPIVPETRELHTGTFSEQCHLVLKNINAILEAAGSSLNDVVKVTIFLKNMEDFGDLNTIYSEYFNESKQPERVFKPVAFPGTWTWKSRRLRFVHESQRKNCSVGFHEFGAETVIQHFDDFR